MGNVSPPMEPDVTDAPDRLAGRGGDLHFVWRNQLSLDDAGSVGRRSDPVYELIINDAEGSLRSLDRVARLKACRLLSFANRPLADFATSSSYLRRLAACKTRM